MKTKEITRNKALSIVNKSENINTECRRALSHRIRIRKIMNRNINRQQEQQKIKRK
jgi:hypothetical protein